MLCAVQTAHTFAAIPPAPKATERPDLEMPIKLRATRRGLSGRTSGPVDPGNNVVEIAKDGTTRGRRELSGSELVEPPSFLLAVPPAAPLPPPHPPLAPGSHLVRPGEGTLQTAYNTCTPPSCNELVLMDGNYTVRSGAQVLRIDKDIRIRALNVGMAAVLDGEGVRRVVLITRGTVVLEGLVITRGRVSARLLKHP